MSSNPRRDAQDQLGKDAIAHNAALRGASMAFGNGKPLVKPKPQINTYAGNDGALAAATKVGAGLKKTIPKDTLMPDTAEDGQRLGIQNTGGSIRSINGTAHANHRSSLGPFDGGGNGLLKRSGMEIQARAASGASLMAAQLAVSRSPSVSPNPTGFQPPASSNINVARLAAGVARRARSPAPSVRSSSPSTPSSPLDITPIPPTTSLIDMFEKNGAATSNRPVLKRTTTSLSRKGGLSPQRSPRRARTPSPIRQKPRKPDVISLKPNKPAPPSNSRTSEAAKPLSPMKKPTPPAAKPVPISNASKPRPRQEIDDDDDASSDDSFVSASDYQPSFRAALANQRTIPRQRSAVSLNSTQTIDSLANAIVASSLASSRAASPSRSSLHPPPPPPSRRNGRTHHLFHHSSSSRTPSPAKAVGLRTTLRKSKSKDDIDEGQRRRTKKAHLMKKHPNKHHEGDRKRWRDEVTERERKRFEAVWASNKGLHLSSVPGAENLVSGLVVRDIWTRSRLQNDTLEEVYALVDRTETGMLDKESFVCGLWLIDQWLKGRKLPPRVSDSVWRSLGMRGLKVRGAK